MKRQKIEVEIEFEDYIAHPYWPEKQESIEIEKNSGMNRQKSDEKRQAALKGELDKRAMSMADYDLLKEKAARQFYRVDADDPATPIVIPRHQISGSVVETIGKSTKNVRGKFTKDNFRSFVRMSDFITDRTDKDGTFDRYVKLDTSHMRSRQANDYIEKFKATGTLLAPADKSIEDVERLFRLAIEETGLGASRKMGYGRGVVTKFEPV